MSNDQTGLMYKVQCALKQVALAVYLCARIPFICLIRLVARPTAQPVQKISKVLIIRLDRLGDFVLTMPVVENIKAFYPDALIHVLVRPYLADLARLIPSIDSVIVYDGFLSTVRRLRAEHYNVAIDMLSDYTLKPAVLALLADAPARAGFARGSKELLFTAVAREDDGKRSMVDLNLEIVKALGISVTATLPRITLAGEDAKREKTVVIHPGGHYPSQCWPASRFGALAEKIANIYNVDIAVVGGPGDEEIVASVVAGVRNGRAAAVFPDMKELARILGKALLVVCNNSGPLHLAAALGTPTVSTMGPTAPALWWPQGPDAIVIRKDISCSPCSRGTCASHACMDAITIDEMFEKAKSVLDRIDGIKRDQ